MTTKFIYPVDKTIIWSTISGITILTNSYMLILICRKNRLWSSINAILASMFTAGILFGSIYLIPRFAYGNLMELGSFCHLVISFGQALSVIFMLHQCLVCLDRYLAVLSPLKYRLYTDNKIVITVVLLIWLLAFTGASIPLMTFSPIQGPICNLTTQHVEAETVFLFTLLGALFFLPLLVILITYAHIIHIFNHRDPLVLPVHQNSTKLSFLQKNRKLVMNVAIITSVLIVMWCPYVTIVLIYRVKTSYSPFELTVINIVQYFAFSYPAVSPLLYAYNMKSLRREVIKDYNAFCCNRQRRRVHTELSIRQSNISNVNHTNLARKFPPELD
ncbi:Histamine H2 receptor [Trichoplax sp. H2]|uniref:G-protein coupled receptors family 1 profile domain-containing protein n=1 Tax=Trichoplax adhaerens TaxID=10228 RepID=B3S5X1_TRIAD|nr:hypothetical protein TRIADDRAFT_59537 [Trichoplax adhaerens]EDV21882.1 hypothetical protein TRIADDRAFT_59537 [Trichoplax adhaerens]RDD39062.1 Histamine H2 receptor [Trichoplax sp. H2]|eukprot:XP_002115519.1 hypothetical protein TRIADDRAFT_59537 [Trichoplax adhaerens]